MLDNLIITSSLSSQQIKFFLNKACQHILQWLIDPIIFWTCQSQYSIVNILSSRSYLKYPLHIFVFFRLFHQYCQPRSYSRSRAVFCYRYTDIYHNFLVHEVGQLLYHSALVPSSLGLTASSHHLIHDKVVSGSHNIPRMSFQITLAGTIHREANYRRLYFSKFKIGLRDPQHQVNLLAAIVP